MSIHERVTSKGETHYVVRWRDPRPRERTFHRKVDAERFERGVRHQVDTGTYRDPSLAKITFRQWYDRWWPTVEASGRAPNTIAHYQSVLTSNVLPYIGHYRLAELRRIHFEEWLGKLAAKGLSSSTLHAARTLAGMVLGSAVDSGIIPANPISGLKLVSGTSKTRQALTVEQVERLADAVGPWWRPLVLVLAYCGLRPGEAAALRRRHLSAEGQLTIEAAATEHRGQFIESNTKTRRARAVQVPSSVLREVQAHLDQLPTDPDTPIFATESGHRLRLSNWRDAVWRPAAEKAGLPDWATPYTLRHTAASLMAQRGVPVATAAAALGHDPAVFLRTYAHVYPGDLKAAADALDGARRAAPKPRKRPRGGRGAAGISRGRRKPSKAH